MNVRPHVAQGYPEREYVESLIERAEQDAHGYVPDAADYITELADVARALMTHKTEPREYRNDWIGERYPLETRYGVVTIQPLGWGVRVQTRFKYGHAIPDEWSADATCDPFLTINGRRSRLGWMDYRVDERAEVSEGNLTQSDDGLTRNAEEKIAAELRPLVLAWLAEHAHDFALTREAYVSNSARTCEESIRELEDALDIYRARLVRIESGEQGVSPYLNGGRRLAVDE